MKRILALFFALTLSGCSVFNDTAPALSAAQVNLDWTTHQAKLATLSNWSISGKLAIFINDDRETANLYWKQQGENYSIQLTSFIGTRILSIKKTPQGVEIINHEGDKFTGQDTEQLIESITPGLHLPISSLQQWIKGNPVNASYRLNPQNKLGSLIGNDTNNGLWEINYQQYQTFSDVALPRKLDLKRDNLRLKIAINQWQLK